jgi:hypothetical protein
VAAMTGTNFSSWYNQSEGTVFADYRLLRAFASLTRVVASVNDASTSNRFTKVVYDSAGAPAFGTLRNTANAGLLFTPSVANTPAFAPAGNRTALAVANLDVALCANGGTVGTATTYAPPLVTQMEIGRQLNALYFGGHIKRLTYWGSRLSNETLERLTA